MAAAGGDTVIPTNWKGLLLTAIAVAIVAGLTYVGLNAVLGHAEGEGTAKPETTLQDLYSVNARRDIPAMDTVRALPRTALAPLESLPPPVLPSEEDAIAAADDLEATDELEDAAELEEELSEMTSSSEAALGGSTLKEPVAENDVPAEPTALADSTSEDDEVSTFEEAPVAVEPITPAAAASAPTEPALDTRYRATTAALRAWWSQENTPADALGIRFVGPLDSSVAPQGMAVLFDQAVDAQTFASFARLTTAGGKTVQPQWVNGQNPRLIYAQSLNPGRYTLSLEEGLPARNGYNLPQSYSGAVFVN